ncbi:MAG: MFS transporter [Candidatus Rokubacteria bacterium]|nr:MFS transporter [Candidatus Rokubacteria bacterium]MBI2494285.1 MFS transporter [Candidatus Rokubacteria bacterium]MBI4254962.1 MFS transporter [Candidatus Rokubacteria bacterium]MBI4627401.1 MFS transporter [Candidatus Rokubacteria bacterium]
MAPGDLNGFLGLALDNVTQLVILSSLLIGAFQFPADLVLSRMLPGTALGVLVGDLAYTWLAVRLARRTGRADVTAMPFGIDTPTLFAMVFGVLGPVKLATGDAALAWKVGMATTLAIGLAKLGLAFGGDWARRVVPRAALLGSIAGVAILLIAFLPTLKILRDPLVGLVALGVLLLALFSGVRMPWGLPGAFAAMLAGTLIFWGRAGLGAGHEAATLAIGTPRLALPWPTLAWLDALGATLPYLSIALPFALVTIIGGIDNTESAAAAGDEYRTRDILLTEAAATLVAGLCGGVIQNTPYIGHPAYKAMGARAGYTLATGLAIGLGAATGLLSILVALLPEAAIAPILVFIGLEITAQAFLASPPRHGAAVALTFVPAAAAVVLIVTGGVLSALGASPASLTGEAAATHRALLVLGNGFILTSVLWGWALVTIIDRRFAVTAGLCAVASVATLFGVIHSPLASGALFWPWAVASPVPARLAGAYGALAALAWLAATRAARRISA